MTFHDTFVNPNVRHARHAISIDENRADFQRVEWTWRDEKGADGREPVMKQFWFLGNHSDVGGSYSENESRLSDIALQWMINEASEVEYPIITDPSYLNLFPSPDGLQHDERKVGVPLLWWRYSWKVGHRKIHGPDTTLHPSVYEALKLPAVLHYDEWKKYRPETLRHHEALQDYYRDVPSSTCDCLACRDMRGLKPLPTITQKVKKLFDFSAVRAKAKGLFERLKPRSG